MALSNWLPEDYQYPQQQDTPAMQQVRNYFSDSPVQNQELPPGFNDGNQGGNTPIPDEQAQPLPAAPPSQQIQAPQGLIGAAQPQVQPQPAQGNPFERGANPNLIKPVEDRTGQADKSVSLRPDQTEALTGEKAVQPSQGKDVFDTPMEPDDWWRNVRDEVARNPNGSTAQKFNNMRLTNIEGLNALHQAALETDKNKRAAAAEIQKQGHEKAMEDRRAEIEKEKFGREQAAKVADRQLINQDKATERQQEQDTKSKETERIRQEKIANDSHEKQKQLDDTTGHMFTEGVKPYLQGIQDGDPEAIKQKDAFIKAFKLQHQWENPNSKMWQHLDSELKQDNAEGQQGSKSEQHKADAEAKQKAFMQKERSDLINKYTFSPSNLNQEPPSEEWIGKMLAAHHPELVPAPENIEDRRKRLGLAPSGQLDTTPQTFDRQTSYIGGATPPVVQPGQHTKLPSGTIFTGVDGKRYRMP